MRVYVNGNVNNHPTRSNQVKSRTLGNGVTAFQDVCKATREALIDDGEPNVGTKSGAEHARLQQCETDAKTALDTAKALVTLQYTRERFLDRAEATQVFLNACSARQDFERK